jgi:hypothetical protein
VPLGSMAICAAAAEGSHRPWEKEFIVDAAGALFSDERRSEHNSAVSEEPG